MDFRQLQCFVAVAEELHFGRAAERLHLSQPPLSQQIRNLETRLGVRLFERNRRSVQVTAAGEAFLSHAHEVLRVAQLGVVAAQRAGAGETGQLRVGYSTSALYADVVLQAIVAYRKRHPDVDLQLVEGTTRSNARDVEEGRINTAFVRGPLPEGVAAWKAARVRRLSRERLMVALPRAHPLAGRRAIAIKELQDERFVALARHLGTALNELIHGLFDASGQARPQIAMEATEMSSLLGLVGASAGIAIVPTTVAQARSRYVVFRALSDQDADVELFQLLSARPVATAERLAAMLSVVR